MNSNDKFHGPSTLASMNILILIKHLRHLTSNRTTLQKAVILKLKYIYEACCSLA